MVDKIQTHLSVLSVATGEKSSGLTGETIASVTPENAFQKRKRKKSLAMFPPRKDPISNQD